MAGWPPISLQLGLAMCVRWSHSSKISRLSWHSFWKSVPRHRYPPKPKLLEQFLHVPGSCDGHSRTHPALPCQTGVSWHQSRFAIGSKMVQVGVPNHQISFIWTGRALGDCMAAVVTSIVFRFATCLVLRHFFLQEVHLQILAEVCFYIGLW